MDMRNITLIFLIQELISSQDVLGQGYGLFSVESYCFIANLVYLVLLQLTDQAHYRVKGFPLPCYNKHYL